MKKTIHFFIFCLFVSALISCNEEDEDTPLGESGEILISTMIPNSDGLSGSAYMQLIENMEATSLTNIYSINIPFSSVPCINGDDVFIIPGWGGETEYMTKYSRVSNKLVEQWEYLLPTNSGATNVVTDGDIAYVASAYSGEILVLDHTDTTLITQIDISDYGVGDQNPDASSMLLRDGYLYVGLIQMVGGYFPAQDRPYSDVLIIDTETNEVLKMITDSTSGISTPTRPIDPYSIFMDENEDIYVMCLGAWGAYSGHNSGILRIKSGETEFDSDYQFVLNTTSIEGESNYLDYLHAVKYYGDGILYATANIPAYYSETINYIEDRTAIPVEIDLEAKTIKKLDLPYSNSYGVSVGQYEDNILFGLATTTDNGIYTYNPSTGEASTSAIVTTEGYPYTVNSFSE